MFALRTHCGPFHVYGVVLVVLVDTGFVKERQNGLGEHLKKNKSQKYELKKTELIAIHFFAIANAHDTC